MNKQIRTHENYKENLELLKEKFNNYKNLKPSYIDLSHNSITKLKSKVNQTFC